MAIITPRSLKTLALLITLASTSAVLTSESFDQSWLIFGAEAQVPAASSTGQLQKSPQRLQNSTSSSNSANESPPLATPPTVKIISVAPTTVSPGHPVRVWIATQHIPQQGGASFAPKIFLDGQEAIVKTWDAAGFSFIVPEIERNYFSPRPAPMVVQVGDAVSEGSPVILISPIVGPLELAASSLYIVAIATALVWLRRRQIATALVWLRGRQIIRKRNNSPEYGEDEEEYLRHRRDLDLKHEYQISRLYAEIAERDARIAASASSTAEAEEASGEKNSESEPSPEFPLPVPDSQLLDACVHGGCLLYAGPLLTDLAGFPSWTEILSGLINRNADDLSKSPVNAMRSRLSRGDTEAVSELLEKYLGRDKMLSQIAEMNNITPASDVLGRLALHIPFSGYVSTSFDTLIETSIRHRNPIVLNSRSRYDFVGLMREQRPFVLRLRGELTIPDSVTLTSTELTAAVEETPNLRALLAALLGARTMLFLGASSEEIIKFVELINLRVPTSQRHYAFVPDEAEFDITEERFLTRFNIVLVRLSNAKLRDFVADLAERVQKLRRVLTPVERAQFSALAPANVQRVVLNNIGPFHEAEFNFPNTWTLILGNNGAGKSTVLRAIALALSGTDESARDLARSLLRRGATTGSIELTLATAPTPTVYRTTLLLEQGRIILKASVAPLQAGTVLAFGFPTLRGVAPNGRFDLTHEENYSYPRVLDVIPLIRGGVDDRGVSLRRWIFNNYIRSQDPQVSEGQRQRYLQMTQSLFTLIDKMTPGFSLVFSRCDTETFEILLSTSDGEVPLDYVSQGMSSTIGWAGTFIQRLYEIHWDSANPEKQHAILLIDEVDTHLHPEWQQTLIPSLALHFPNIQVIATTHSPLMVGSLKENELIRINRTDNKLEVQHFSQSFHGYRADQILTGEAFGLESSRSLTWRALRDEYAMLIGISNRSVEQSRRMRAIERELAEVAPPFETREEIAEIREVEKALDSRFATVAAESSGNVAASNLQGGIFPTEKGTI